MGHSVIRAITKSDQRDSGKRAERVLDRFIEYHDEFRSREMPDFNSFSRILHYYATLGQPDSPYSAEYVLNRAINRFYDGYRDLAINSKAFVAVIEAYTAAKHPDAGRFFGFSRGPPVSNSSFCPNICTIRTERRSTPRIGHETKK